MKKKVLLIRLDKIGDLICTMCVDQVSFLKDHDIHWAIAKGLAFVPEHASPKRSFLELDKNNWKDSLQKLREFLKQYQPDVAVSFQAPWWVSYALWAENIPVRAGVQSQWHSFLFFNKGLRQKRSLATQHESEYNMDLLRHALEIPAPVDVPTLILESKNDDDVLSKYHLSKNDYVVVHPGMAGSALNWPIASYIELIERVLPLHSVVLTGTPADEPWLTEIKARFKDHKNFINLQNELKPTGLFSILKNAKAVIVPSTGVAHMAASLGGKVLGLYSPLRVQHPRRWAARGKDVTIFCPAERTNYDDVSTLMNEISVSDVFNKLIGS